VSIANIHAAINGLIEAAMKRADELCRGLVKVIELILEADE
jgi:hypothetical protein